jgi:hypothetical protein
LADRGEERGAAGDGLTACANWGAAKNSAPFLNSVTKLSKSTHAALPLLFWFNYAQIEHN